MGLGNVDHPTTPLPLQEQLACQSNSRFRFRNFWNRGIWRFRFLGALEYQVFSVVWGWGWYFRDADCCPATHFRAFLSFGGGDWGIPWTGAFTTQRSLRVYSCGRADNVFVRKRRPRGAGVFHVHGQLFLSPCAVFCTSPTALPWQGVWAATTTFGEEAGVEASVVVCIALRPPRPCHPEKKLEKCRRGLLETPARCVRGAQRGARGAGVFLSERQ